MPRSSPEQGSNGSDKRYQKWRRRRRKKRWQLNQHSVANAKHGRCHQAEKRQLFASSKCVQAGKERKSPDHQSLLRQHFGPKVTTKTRLTRPVHVTGMFAQGAQSIYIARDTMTEATKAYLKEDLRHIIEMANPRAESSAVKTLQKKSAAFFPQENSASGFLPLTGPPLNSSCDVDDPTPDTFPEDSCRASPAGSAVAHVLARSNHVTRFSPQQMSTPRDEGMQGLAVSQRQCRAGNVGSAMVWPRYGRRPGCWAKAMVLESSSDSSSAREQGALHRRPSPPSPPTYDFGPFAAAYSDSAVALKATLAGMSWRSDWLLENQRKLQDLYTKCHSEDGNQLENLKSFRSRLLPEKGVPAENNSQQSSSQQSTGVQTSPSLLSQPSQVNRAHCDQACSPAATCSDTSSPDLGVKLRSPCPITLDPTLVLEMLSSRAPLPADCNIPGRGASTHGLVERMQNKAATSQCGCCNGCSSVACALSCEGQLLHQSAEYPHRKHLQVEKIFRQSVESNLGSCNSSEEESESESNMKRVQALVPTSDEESPLITYFCFRRH